ncbi:MAG: methylmalonyl-CoA mutase family protein [Pseudorhodoplanes sp.]|uniref:methylmalonyl-CoA mutase family protein n=1 Tax=Pseudorhodoplanes sp. TaxID=1934341 RepID=UPI003D0FA679
MAQDLPLASEFPPATREQWLKLVDGVLKGAPFDRKLVGTTYDGLRIDPLYGRRADANVLTGRAPGMPWQIMARVDHPDPKEANRQALEDLENGANGLVLVCPGAIGSQGFGTDVSADGIATLLDGVFLDAGAPIEFMLTREAKDVPAHVAAIITARKLAPAACDLRIGFDPIGLMAAGSSAPVPWSEIAPLFARMTRTLADEGFRGPFAVADARVIHSAGGSEAQELAYALSVAVAYWRALEAGGVALDKARRMIFFRLSADADQFMTMAKFRALRKLWARVEEASGLTPAPAFIAAETAWRMMTQRDPYVNMLRVTIAAFAAGLGGANAITVLPFTAALGLPDGFARRVARNTQLVLLEESSLAKVADPAAGSGGIEALTDGLCRTAWALFQGIEKAGGIAAALECGLIQKQVAETRTTRESAVAMRKDPITGTSEFPFLAEMAVNILMPAPLLDSPPQAGKEQTGLAALPAIRLAEPFEKLRDASDAKLKKTGARPKVFLATLGKPADSIARATFAKNFFEAGGIEAMEIAGGDLAAAFRQSGAALACLCSSNEVYENEAAAAAKALVAAGAKQVYLAGRPGDLADALKQAGVQAFIYAGCDALATLETAHEVLRKAP